MEISRGQARRRPRLKTTTRMHPERVPEPPVYTRITHPYIPCGMALVAQRPPLGVATACRHNLKTPSRCRIFHRFFLLPCAPRFPARFFASPRLCAFALNPRFPPKTAPLDCPKMPTVWHALAPLNTPPTEPHFPSAGFYPKGIAPPSPRPPDSEENS